MYQENGGLHGGGDAFSMNDQSNITAAIAAASAVEMELQHHLEIEPYYFNGENMHHHHHHQQHIPAADNFNQILNMFSLPPPSLSSSPSLLPNMPVFFGDVNHDGGAAAYDPLNLPPQHPLLRELLHSLPHGFAMDERERNGDDERERKSNSTEKQRRAAFGNKYEALKSLLPGPTKKDRASILSDAISYINELKRTETELKILVQNKKYARERNKRPKHEECVGDIDSYNGSSLRSSWLHRKSKHIEVDVRIIEDEITVKLVHQKRINCLLFVSEVLDELHIDLHHVSGGVIGDYYSYLLNSKICEGSVVYASAVANKVIEVVEKQFAAVPPTTSY